MIIATIADVHGEYDKFKEALAKLENYKYDKLVLLGDLFDRGPKNEHMITWVIDHYNDDNKVFIMGNHDEWCFDYLYYMSFSEQQNWMCKQNGGHLTALAIDNINANHPDYKVKDKLKTAMLSFKMEYSIDNLIFAHGGIDLFSEKIIGNTWGDNMLFILDDIKERKSTRRPAKYAWANSLSGKHIILGHWINWLIDKSIIYNKDYKTLENNDIIEDMLPLSYTNEITNTNVYFTDHGVNINDVELGVYIWDSKKGFKELL